MKLKIKYIKEKLPDGYVGMNPEAAKHHFHIKDYPKRTIEIYKPTKNYPIARTLHHEKIENYLMRYKKMRYKKAHNIALKYEATKIPIKQIGKNY